MLSSLRTLGSITRSHAARNPNGATYTVRPVYARRELWAIRLLGTACVTLILAPQLVSTYNAFKLPEKDKPVFIPLGMIEQVAPVPYRRGGREENAHARFMQDEKTRDKAEVLILERAVATVLQSVRSLNPGRPCGYGPSYWMLWKLPRPPPTYQRRYLSVSTDGFKLVTRPVSPHTASRISSILYPRAVFTALYTYWHTLHYPDSIYNGAHSSRAINISSARIQNKGAPVDDDVIGLFSPMETRRALGMGFAKLQKEWSKSRKEPPPARGWPVADCRFMLNGPNLSLTIDCLATINPQKVEADQVRILTMEIKHIQPNHSGTVLLGQSKSE